MLFTAKLSMPKPFLKWVGGKSWAVPKIKKVLPSFSTYYEPFFGSGSLFFHLSPARAFLSDFNSELIQCYQQVRDNHKAVLDLLDLLNNEEAEYYTIRSLDRIVGWKESQCLPTLRAARFIYLNRTGRSFPRYNSNGECNSPYAKYTSDTYKKDWFRESVKQCSELLNQIDVAIDCAHYKDVIPDYPETAFVYLDPPYAGTPHAEGAGYSSDRFSQEELAEYCRHLSAIGVKWLQSNSEDARPLYDGWTDIDTIYRPGSMNSKSSDRGKVPELLIRNY